MELDENSSYCWCCCWPPVDISHCCKKHFYFILAAVSSIWWDDCGGFIIFFSSFLFTRQRNCDTVLIRSFPVTQCEVQCAGANSGTKWRHLVFGSQLFSSIPFLVFHCKLVNVTCSCFSCPLGVTGPHILDLYRVPCQVGAVPQGTSRGRSSVLFFF